MRRPVFLIAWCALVSILPGCGGDRDHRTGPRPDIQGRVLLLGLDGADWEILDRLEREGTVPNLARLRREGAWGVLRSEEPLLSPIVWTTIATGRPPTDHGIVGFLTRRNGALEPVRSDERRVRAFWNVASDLGVPVGVIGWYASWPAEPVKGFLVSDRVGSHQVAGSGRVAAGGLVHPPDLFPQVKRLQAEVERDVTATVASKYFSSGHPGGSAFVGIDQGKLDTFVGILRTTELYRRLTPRLLDVYEPALAAVYFEGTDAVGHLFAAYAPPRLPWVDPGDVIHFGEAWDRYYQEVDGIVGEIVARLNPTETTVLIVSDHGFKTGTRRPEAPPAGGYANQAPIWHRPEGVFLAWGRGIRSGAQLPDSSIYDVLPTAFRALGIPLAETLKGRPVDAAFTSEILARGIGTVPDYESAGQRVRDEGAEAPADDSLAKLRALGYIGPAPPSLPATDAGNEVSGQGGVPLNRYNEGLILLRAGKREEARQIFVALQRDEPAFPLGFLGEGLVHLESGEATRAVGPFEQALRVDPRLGAALGYLGEAYLRAGREEEALRTLKKAVEFDRSNPWPALLASDALMALRRLAEAKPLLTAAKERSQPQTVTRARACVGLAIVAEEEGQLGVADAQYDQALREVADFPPALERWANLQMYRKRPEAAVRLLERLVKTTGGSTRSVALLDRALVAAGRSEEARQAPVRRR